jgi:hypothetical protein
MARIRGYLHMDLFSVVSLIVGVVGTVIAVAAAVRGRQLSRPRLVVTIAPPKPDSSRPKAIRQAPFAGLVVGTPQRADSRQFVCPIVLSNQSAIPVNDLVLRLEYPSEYVMEHVVFFDLQKEVARVFRFKDDNRQVFQMSGMASVSLDLGLLRPGDSVMTADVLQLKPHSKNLTGNKFYDEDFANRIGCRFRDVRGLIGIVPINVYIRASNIPPQAFAFTILWLQGGSISEVGEATIAVADASWEGRHPISGYYLRPFILRALRKPVLWRREKFRVLFMDGGHEPINLDGLLEETISAENGDALVDLPPWGLIGQSFDLSPAVVGRVWPPSMTF